MNGGIPMLRSFVLVVLCSCGNGNIKIINETNHRADYNKIIEMVYRLWPQANTDLNIYLRPESAEELSGINGVFQYGLDKTDTVRVKYGGYISTSYLAHELIHWRCLHLYGDSDGEHETVDWYLVKAINEEFNDRE